MNSGNIKAHFRKSACYKAIREYTRALQVAEEALKQARKQSKTQEVCIGADVSVVTDFYSFEFVYMCFVDAIVLSPC